MPSGEVGLTLFYRDQAVPSCFLIGQSSSSWYDTLNAATASRLLWVQGNMHVAVSREPHLNTNEEPFGLSQASYMIRGGQGCKLQRCTALADIEDDAPAEARGMPGLLRLGLKHNASAQSRPGDMPGVRG